MRISDWSSDVCSSDLVAKAYRPGHADYAYDAKYGFRDYRGGGRSSARETAARVAAGGVARLVIPEVSIRAYLIELGGDSVDRASFDDAEIDRNPFFCPDAAAAARWASSEERRAGKECVRTCRSRCAPDPSKQNSAKEKHTRRHTHSTTNLTSH